MIVCIVAFKEGARLVLNNSKWWLALVTRDLTSSCFGRAVAGGPSALPHGERLHLPAHEEELLLQEQEAHGGRQEAAGAVGGAQEAVH